MITIILVNWNGAPDTIECIESLLAAKWVQMRIIVVDNSSSDDSLKTLADWGRSRNFPGINNTCIGKELGEIEGNLSALNFGRYLESDRRFEGFNITEDCASKTSAIYVVDSGRNGGFGFGCNVGLRLGDLLGTNTYWLLNNDCVVSEDSLYCAAATVEINQNTVFGMIVRYFVPPHSVQVYGGGYISRLTGKNVNAITAPMKGSMDYIYGASMIFSSRVRLAVGDFDEKIFMYYEEMDYCLRARAVGINFDVLDSEVLHKHGSSQGGVSSAAWANVLFNKYYVLRKHFGWGLWTVVYFASLLARCALPIGGQLASVGARNTLKAILTQRKCQW